MADGVMGEDLFTRKVFLQWDMDRPALSTLRELKPPPKWQCCGFEETTLVPELADGSVSVGGT